MNPRTQEIRRPGPPQVGAGSEVPSATFCVQLSSTRRGARLARLLATQWLDEHAVPYRSTSSHHAALVVAELAANAVRHCGGVGRDFRLRLTLTGTASAGRRLRVESRTHARTNRCRPGGGAEPPGPEEESGRGLLLVDALADRWGDRTDDRITKTLWAELALPGERQSALPDSHKTAP
ncbi:ATP-binding protein [Streptomyces sp. NPDC007025]|uniref:ATP-binding protein n=1 Tax=Streptomyces sp. NPDC007025 TaxID=3364771 RepID=UPI0036744D38